jgi:hypothetical protein
LKETIKRLSSIFEERREREQLAAAQALKLACAICKSAGFRSEEAVIPYPFEPLIFNSPFSCRVISPSAVSAIAQLMVRSIM